MSPEENKAIVQRHFDDLNRRDIAAAVELLTSDFVYRGGPQMAVVHDGRDAFTALLRGFFSDPSLQVTVEDMVAAGDKVAFRLTYHSSKDGKPVTSSSIAITRLLPNGKMVEVRDAYLGAT